MAKLKELREKHKYIVHVQVLANGFGMHSGHTFLQTTHDRYMCVTHRTPHYIIYIHSYCHPYGRTRSSSSKSKHAGNHSKPRVQSVKNNDQKDISAAQT